MGGEPPQHEEEGEGRDERAIQARGHSVAQLLGEEWRTDGDGIYRLAAEADPPEQVPSPNGPVERDAGRDAVDDLIAELTADLGGPEEPGPFSADGDGGTDRHHSREPEDVGVSHPDASV